MSAPIVEGWAWPLNMRKAHYVRKGTSLCGRMMYLGSHLEPDIGPSPDNCKECQKRRLKEVTP
jgi:hypothetical protein